MCRQVGIEIELGGLEESRLAELVADELAGEVAHKGAQRYVVTDTAIGDVEVYLDTAFRVDKAGLIGKLGLDAARSVVPVEIVTPPMDPGDIKLLDRLCEAARRQGATGTRDGLLLGFGVHLNVETTGDTLNDILPTLQAYALLEDLIRNHDPIDPSRRLLPFVDPYPRALVDALASHEFGSVTDLITCYLTHSPTRNRGLDMLPIFAEIDRDLVERHIGSEQKLSARLAYHFRLPDCRIDDPDWSLQREWDRWCALEEIANDAGCLGDLKDGWTAHRGDWTTLRPEWADKSKEILKRHKLPGPFL